MPFISDAPQAIRTISAWLREQLKLSGRSEFVLGLSGGIDSALAAYLAVEAVGRDGLLCLLLPYKTSSRSSLDHAREVIDALKLRSLTVDISDMANAYEKQVADLSPVRRGNLCARLRMITLFDHSHRDGLVLGTSNKTETLLGYGTLFGDAAWSLNPLGDLYKTDVRLLSKQLKVPQSILEKIPTADLWEGQTDEGELGHSYDEIDHLLVKIVDENKTRAQCMAEGIEPKFLERIVSLIRSSAFKRRTAGIAWLGQPYSAAKVEDGGW
jgi:NAD+ synthase